MAKQKVNAGTNLLSLNDAIPIPLPAMAQTLHFILQQISLHTPFLTTTLTLSTLQGTERHWESSWIDTDLVR
jgi:hypothetical protein